MAKIKYYVKIRKKARRVNVLKINKMLYGMKEYGFELFNYHDFIYLPALCRCFCWKQGC